MDTKQEWKPIRNYPGYWVSESGNIWREQRVWLAGKHGSRRVAKAREMPYLLKGKYRRVLMGYHLGHKKLQVHRIVAEHFLGKPKGYTKMVVHHKDGNPGNNHYINLEWLTHKQHHQLHPEIAESFSERQLGSGNTMSKYSEAEILAMDKMWKKGATLTEVCKKFRIPLTTGSAIKSGRVWGWLTGRGYDRE